jgi:hypothetical protein
MARAAPAIAARGRSETMDIGTPRIDHREALPYMGIRAHVTMADLAGDVIPTLLDEVFASLGREGIDPGGAPIVRYHVIDMAAELEIYASSNRISTRGNPLSTDDVSATLRKPTFSKRARVPTYAIVGSTFSPRLSSG